VAAWEEDLEQSGGSPDQIPLAVPLVDIAEVPLQRVPVVKRVSAAAFEESLDCLDG
jgi:hypothetical protein